MKASFSKHIAVSGRWASALLLLTLLSTVHSCIYPYEADLNETDPVLIVEGELAIGDISTFTMSLMNGFSRNSEPVQGVDAQVEDEDGNIVLRSIESSYPRYSDRLGFGYGSGNMAMLDSRDLSPRGKYRVRLKVLSGSAQGEYVTPLMEATLPPVIDSISYHKPPKGSQEKTMYVAVSFHADADSDRYYNVTYVETWRHFSLVYTDSWYDEVNNVVEMEGWDNPEYICYGHNGPIVRNISTEYMSENKIVNYPIIYINEDERKISDIYKVSVRVRSIPPDTYRYWKSLDDVSQVTGDLFSPIPSSVRGNITKVGDPSVMVLGNIGASVESTLTRYVNSYKLSFYRTPNSLYTKMDEGTVDDAEKCADPESWPVMFASNLRPYEAVFGEMSGQYLYHTWIPAWCLKCTTFGGTPVKPEDWNPVFD